MKMSEYMSINVSMNVNMSLTMNPSDGVGASNDVLVSA